MYAAWYAEQSRRDMMRMRMPRHEQWRRLDPQAAEAQEAEWRLKPPIPAPRARQEPIRFFNNRVEVYEPDGIRDRSRGAGLRARRGPRTPAFVPRFELPSDRERPGVALPRGAFRQLRLDDPAVAAARLAWLTSDVRLAKSAKHEAGTNPQHLTDDLKKINSADGARAAKQPGGTVRGNVDHVHARQMHAVSDAVRKALSELRF
jgi:hypothetical protein